MRPIDFRIVDIDQEEIAQPPLRIVKHTHRTVYFEAALLGGNIITVQTIEGIIRLERELLPVPHPAPDLLVENGILEKIDPEHILLVPNPENLQILVIQIDEQAVPVVQFDTDGNIVISFSLRSSASCVSYISVISESRQITSSGVVEYITT